MISNNDRALILIGGYGRSGSTIVDMELSRHFQAHSLGEVRYARRHIEAGYRQCSCGADFKQCVFWSHYSLDNEVLNSLSVVESTNVITALKHILSSDSKFQINQLFSSLFQRSAPRRVVVDSSKTSWGAFLRPVVLASALRKDTKIIFLGVYRHPANVLQSLRRGSNEEMGSADGQTIFSQERRIASPWLKLIMGWAHANVAILVNVLVFKLMGMEAKVFAYEDIVEDFDLISRACSLSPNPETEQVNHLIGGNRLAGRGPVRIKKDVDNAVKPLNAVTKFSLLVLLGPLLAVLRMIRVKPKRNEAG